MENNFNLSKYVCENEFEEYYKQYDGEIDIYNEMNNMLYHMCEENIKHSEESINIAKMMIIGRTYAAALERIKSPNGESPKPSTDDLYKNLGKELGDIENFDENIKKLNTYRTISSENLKIIMDTYKSLFDSLKCVTGSNKISLTSKYLHFHCKNMFFLYDDRARKVVQTLVPPIIRSLPEVQKVCSEYRLFYCRALALQEYLYEKHEIVWTPRQIDNFLMFVYPKLKQKNQIIHRKYM